MHDIMEEFKTFAFKGNAIDLAVAVVLAQAFGAVINSLVNDLVMPIIGIFGGSPDFSANTFTINGSVFHWGNFVTVVISFIIVALVLFFFVIRPMNALMKRAGLNAPEVTAEA